MNSLGIDLWQSAAEDLNRIIQLHGGVKPNNRSLWRSYLNLWDNRDWCAVLEAVYAVYQQEPEHFRENHVRVMRDALCVLDAADHPRALDLQPNRKTAWQMFMALREIWNSIQGTAIQNREPDIHGRIFL